LTGVLERGMDVQADSNEYGYYTSFRTEACDERSLFWRKGCAKL
jgi:hypothetical protein